MRLCSLCVVVLLMVAARAARAADAPAPSPAPAAKPSALTDEERAFFSWWDGLACPDVTKLPFVKVWSPYRHHSAAAEDEAWPEGAFLVSEDGSKFTLFHTD